MQDIIEQLKEKLFDSVRANSASGILFSGGLDSSVLACINRKVKTVSVSFKSEGKDIYYSNLAAKFLNMEHFHKNVNVDEAIEAIPQTIKILKSFDPALPNDLAVYFGLRLSKEKGIKKIMTGDGSDELFAGYSFMQGMDNLEKYIQRISKKMRFSSNEIGNFFGIKIVQPFMDKNIVNFALQIPIDLKIKNHKDKISGKWILRKAFEDMLPAEIIWQSKRPLECGSGMTKLRDIISAKITDKEFKENTYPIKFINKEHFYYYKIYRKVIGEIPKPKNDEKNCPGCGTGIKKDGFHCKICGYVLGRP
jgi:asparagine synthase (glutamine-hydrolysing)